MAVIACKEQACSYDRTSGKEEDRETGGSRMGEPEEEAREVGVGTVTIQLVT